MAPLIPSCSQKPYTTSAAARVVNIVLLMRVARPSNTDQAIPAPTPSRQAAINEKPAEPRSPVASTSSPLARLTATPTVPMMQNTSVNVLSRVKTVPVSSPSSRALTMGMTTADEVPPMISPPRSAVHQSIPTSSWLTPAWILSITHGQLKRP